MAFVFLAALFTAAAASISPPDLPDFTPADTAREEAVVMNDGAQNTPPESSPTPTKQSVAPKAKTFEPFTGKITGSKVRVRLQPGLDGAILKEINRGTLVVVLGEADGFYAIRPEKGQKGYVYRAYVLDNTVEANNVNVRLEPDTHSPVLTQLAKGDQVSGTICPENGKWLVVDLPESVRWYVAKEYVAHIGDLAFFQRVQNRREQVSSRLASLDEAITDEMKKPFSDIQLVPLVNDLKAVIAQNQDLPEMVDRATDLIKNVQEQYLQLSQGKRPETPPTAPELPPQKAQVACAMEPQAPPQTQAPSPLHRVVSFSLEQQEHAIVDQAIQSGTYGGKEAFYEAQLKTAQELSGQLIPYERPVKNRPGDFVLVDAKTKVPLAYLYSVQFDLGPLAGKTVHLHVTPRPNHHFALPAYLVLTVDGSTDTPLSHER